MHLLRRLAPLLAAALLLTGCPGDEAQTPETPEPAPDDGQTPAATHEPEPDPEPDDELGAECTNPEGFSVAYPEGWLTNDQEVDGLAPCSLFDPESVELGETMHVPLEMAAFLRLEPVELEPPEEPGAAEELEREELTLDGRDALRIETRATGGGMVPEGTRTTTYRVDVGGEDTFVATTHDVGEPDYDRKQRVLGAMVDSLRFDVEEPQAREGRWEELPQAPVESRRNHAAVWDGQRLMVWGGGFADGVFDDGAAWDPEGERWELLPAAPLEARWGALAVWTGQEVLVWGGNEGPDHLARCYTDGAAYDPTAGQWRVIAPAPVDNRCAPAVWTGEQLIVWGGSDGGGPPGSDDFHDDGLAYDPHADDWRPLPAAPIGPRNPAVTAWSGQELLVFGGSDPEYEPLRDGAAYNPATDRWRLIPEAPLPPRGGAHGVWIGDELLVFGGQTTDGEPILDTAAYDPQQDAWRTLEPMPTPHDMPATAWTGGVLYVVGGAGDDPAASAFDAYVPGEDTWVDQSDPPGGPRIDHTVTWTGRQLLVWGGETRPDGEMPPGAAWTPPTE